MGINSLDLQFKSADGAIYVFVRDEHKWYKWTPAAELPRDVREQVEEIKEKTEALSDIEEK
jgi:hypothetical protein